MSYKIYASQDYVNEKTNNLVSQDYVEEKIYTLSTEIPTTLSQLSEDETHRLVTDEEKALWNSANSYTDTKIAGLINGAPTTLDTLKEIADAMSENQDVVSALEMAIGVKADLSDLNTHKNNTTIHITSDERTKWNSAI